MSVSTYPEMMIERLENRIKQLEKQVYNQEAYINILEETSYCEKPLDKSKKEVRDIDVDLVEGEGPMGYYGDV